MVRQDWKQSEVCCVITLGLERWLLRKIIFNTSDVGTSLHKVGLGLELGTSKKEIKIN